MYLGPLIIVLLYLAFALDAHIQAAMSAPGAVVHFAGKPCHNHHRTLFIILVAKRLAFARERTRFLIIEMDTPFVKLPLIGMRVQCGALVLAKFVRIWTGLMEETIRSSFEEG